eukprot:5530865-Pyramimonas_sp.AAC.1
MVEDIGIRLGVCSVAMQARAFSGRRTSKACSVPAQLQLATSFAAEGVAAPARGMPEGALAWAILEAGAEWCNFLCQ